MEGVAAVEGLQEVLARVGGAARRALLVGISRESVAAEEEISVVVEEIVEEDEGGVAAGEGDT